MLNSIAGAIFVLAGAVLLGFTAHPLVDADDFGRFMRGLGGILIVWGCIVTCIKDRKD